MDFVVGNSKKIAKIGFGKINQLSLLNVFTLPKLEIFNSENVKNKTYVHT
jgi:hypothetical protein